MTTSDRLLSVLSLFTAEHPEWTVEDAASTLGLAVSTAYRYFRSLSKAGLILAFSTGRYVLGPAIIQYDRQIRLRDPLTTAAQPVMRRLAAQLPAHTVVILCRLFRNQVICVHQEAAEKPDFAFSYERGRALPLFRGASSKIILANMPPRAVKALYSEHASKFAQASLGKSWDESRERLRALRSAGYSITQGDVDPGMCGIAVPIFEPEGTVMGSLSIVTPARHLVPKFLEAAPQLLRSASEQIDWAVSLGGQTTQSAPARGSAAQRSASDTKSKQTKQPAAKNKRRPRKSATQTRIQRSPV